MYAYIHYTNTYTTHIYTYFTTNIQTNICKAKLVEEAKQQQYLADCTLNFQWEYSSVMVLTELTKGMYKVTRNAYKIFIRKF
jgi:hypothetical protein